MGLIIKGPPSQGAPTIFPLNLGNFNTKLQGFSMVSYELASFWFGTKGDENQPMQFLKDLVFLGGYFCFRDWDPMQFITIESHHHFWENMFGTFSKHGICKSKKLFSFSFQLGGDFQWLLLLVFRGFINQTCS